tara:strand:- start:254 stop:505 length:252 start_codon:yes stop_codon:yes gene_type:complete
MLRFHTIEGGAVILSKRGVFKQANLYRRGRELYAGTAGGFVRLYANGNTGVPDLRWVDLEHQYQSEYEDDALGRLSLKEGYDA